MCGGFDPRAWDAASMLDWLMPVAACLLVYLLAAQPSRLRPRLGGVCFAVFHQQFLDVGFTLNTGASHRRINESLLALALVEPTQYVTQLASRPDTCPAI